MSRLAPRALVEQVSDRDLAVLRDVERLRLVSGAQLQRLHYAGRSTSSPVAVRSGNRSLRRLRDLDLVRTLERRVGGVRSGSTGFIYYLGAAGERLLRQLSDQPSPRRRFSEPSRHFVNHTLAVAELAVQAIEQSQRQVIELLTVETEPANWQASLSQQGVAQWLKPDLLLRTIHGEYEEHWFIEADLDTEHMPVILRQCAAYERYFASGTYQAKHGLFPTVLWVAPSPVRAEKLRSAIATGVTQQELFQVCTAEQYRRIISE